VLVTQALPIHLGGDDVGDEVVGGMHLAVSTMGVRYARIAAEAAVETG